MENDHFILRRGVLERVTLNHCGILEYREHGPVHVEYDKAEVYPQEPYGITNDWLHKEIVYKLLFSAFTRTAGSEADKTVDEPLSEPVAPEDFPPFFKLTLVPQLRDADNEVVQHWLQLVAKSINTRFLRDELGIKEPTLPEVIVERIRSFMAEAIDPDAVALALKSGARRKPSRAVAGRRKKNG